MNKQNFKFSIGLLLLLFLFIGAAQAQQASLVQVKAFDLDLKAISNLEISFDKQNFFTTDGKGSIFTEIDDAFLPPKAIYFANENLEAESWNYSKGILEIIVREKLFENYRLIFVDSNGMSIEKLAVKLKTATPIEAVTDNSGILQLAVPINTDFSKKELLDLNGYSVIKTSISDNTVTVQAAKIPPKPKEEPVAKVEEANQIKELDLSHLDSLTNLPRFWAFTRVLDMKSLTVSDKLLLDKKFNELWANYSDSLMQSSLITSNISDSSLVTDDILYLSERAKLEGQQLTETRKAFNNQITLISEKIVEGGGNLSDSERQQLLAQINELDRLLIANEIRFKENQNYYQSTIADLKNRLLDISVLEEKLTEVQKQSEIERQLFQKRLIMFLAVGSGLLLLLLLFSQLLRRISIQKKALAEVNKEVEDMNNNLEVIVAKRTETLRKVNQELDTFLYRSSHDLQRPLSSIIGLANIAKITLNAEANDLFEKTRITADDMNKLLHKLITISQINSANDNSEINFMDMMLEIHKSFEETIDKNGTEVIYNIDDDVKFTSNPILVDIIMRNLLDNALLYSSFRKDRKPTVEVSVSIKGDIMQVEVKDNGEGISNEISHKVWDMFYRGHLNSTGNGLGLYMIKRAVDVLRGTTTFETAPGEFTKFIVEIPINGARTALGSRKNNKFLVESE